MPAIVASGRTKQTTPQPSVQVATSCSGTPAAAPPSRAGRPRPRRSPGALRTSQRCRIPGLGRSVAQSHPLVQGNALGGVDPATDGVQELKHWQAVLKYVTALPDATGDGVPDVPPQYAAPQGRIVQVTP